jgi:hypothetical protein
MSKLFFAIADTINPSLAAIRDLGGTATAFQVEAYVSDAVPWLTGGRAGAMFRRVLSVGRGVLYDAVLLEEIDGKLWTTTPGVVGRVVDPFALVSAWHREGLARLADWRVEAALAGTLSPALRIAAAYLRLRLAWESGTAARHQMQQFRELLAHAGVDIDLLDQRAGVLTLEETARIVSPVGSDPAVLFASELQLGFLAQKRRPPADLPIPPGTLPRDVRGGRRWGLYEFLDPFDTTGRPPFHDWIIGGAREFSYADDPAGGGAPAAAVGGSGPAPAAAAPEGAAPSDAVASPPTQSPPPRFPDFRVVSAAGDHDHYRPLLVDKDYVLEVRITPRPQGLPTDGTPREALHEPGQSGAVILTVAVDASSHVFVDEPLALVELPSEGTSAPARFAFRVREAKPAKLRVRIYYRLNLLARAMVLAEVVDRVDGDQPRREAVVQVQPEALDASCRELAKLVPRDAHIDVSREQDAYELALAFSKDNPGEIAFRARLRLLPTDVEDALVRVRGVLAKIASEKSFKQQLVGTEHQRATHLRALAKEGRRLWGLLFGKKINSAASALKHVLEDAALPPGSRLQISLERGAESFVLPWPILFPGKLPQEPECPVVDDFWGTRFELEVLTESPVRAEAPVPLGSVMKMKFALGQLANSDKQQILLTRLETESEGRLRGESVRRKSEWFNILKNCDAHLLYFYTHGFTRERKAAIQGVAPAPEGSDDDPDRDRTWIQLPAGRLYLDELENEVEERLPTGPLVFLNMCESAQMTPSLSESMVAFFLDRGASAVIGTECPMTVYFADPFAERLLEAVLRGETVGKALLDARRHFIERDNNALGFAYSLYGTSSLAFAPPVLFAKAGS